MIQGPELLLPTGAGATAADESCCRRRGLGGWGRELPPLPRARGPGTVPFAATEGSGVGQELPLPPRARAPGMGDINAAES
ncbi:hypothetical protein E2562_003881 [Oryza meyeriana var. granulata]|uniref:Uncharacterized protein n=1 Tax=Oryza meyeriana var. granulata TaxID=110450 RepID=A0A6G1D0L6_9ORYZ|nr:hypothetical protein E2562_003881 [Oryza meyeriana var. granulata]